MSCIAFISNYFPTLSETFIYNEVIGLRKRGLCIKTFSIRKPEKENISKESYGLMDSTTYLIPVNYYEFIKALTYFAARNALVCIRILYFLFTRKFQHKIKDRLRTLFHFCEGVYIAKMVVDDGSITHLHAHFVSHPATAALVASRLTKIPFSFTAHAFDIFEDKLFITDKVNAAKFGITCTNYGKSCLLENNGIRNPDKITTIYHGVDTKRFEPEPKASIHPKTTLLTIGRLVETKAQKNLIAACKLIKDGGYDFQCLIIGDGPLYNYLQDTIAADNLQNEVRLVGKVFHEDIKNYYRNADIFVFSSIGGDNLPNVLLESLATGLPVVATGINGIPELIENGVTGLLVRPNNIEEFADAIKLLIDNKELRIKLSENGRKLVCRNFDVEKSLDKILDLYNKHGIKKIERR